MSIALERKVQNGEVLEPHNQASYILWKIRRHVLDIGLEPDTYQQVIDAVGLALSDSMRVFHGGN